MRRLVQAFYSGTTNTGKKQRSNSALILEKYETIAILLHATR